LVLLLFYCNGNGWKEGNGEIARKSSGEKKGDALKRAESERLKKKIKERIPRTGGTIKEERTGSRWVGVVWVVGG